MNHNDELYTQLLMDADPQLYLIKTALHETGVNPNVIPSIIKAIANLSYGTGWGEVHVIIKNSIVKKINSSEDEKIEQQATLERQTQT